MMHMDLLPWFLKIPGHERNVRIPTAPTKVVQVIDTLEEDAYPWTMTWGSTLGSEWDFSIGFDVNQGIEGPIPLENIPKINQDNPGKPNWWYRVYHGQADTYTSRSPEEALYDSEMRWQREDERRQSAWAPGNWWSWGYTDETIPQAYTSGLW